MILPFTVHGGGKCKILDFPSQCTVEANARSWRILHSARWRQVQDPTTITYYHVSNSLLEVSEVD